MAMESCLLGDIQAGIDGQLVEAGPAWWRGVARASPVGASRGMAGDLPASRGGDERHSLPACPARAWRPYGRGSRGRLIIGLRRPRPFLDSALPKNCLKLLPTRHVRSVRRFTPYPGVANGWAALRVRCGSMPDGGP